MRRNNNYMLKVGVKGKQRLKILNAIYNPNSQKFLLHSIKPGMQVMDVGCGTGEISCWMAQQVGPAGKVFAVDKSEEQLAIAKQNTSKHQLTNIEFYALTIAELGNLNKKFDLIYCRWLLRHLPDPLKSLQKIRAVLKVGGILICEESVSSAAFCYPPSQAFERWLQIWCKEYEIRGLDEKIGLRLPSLITKAQYEIINCELFQPVLLKATDKVLVALSAEEIGDAAIADKLISAAGVAKLKQQLLELSHKKNFIGFVRNTLIKAKRIV